jgi:elongation factor 3
MSGFADVAKVNADGVLAFEASGVIEELKTQMQSNNAPTAVAALEHVKALCENVDQWIEPYLLELLPYILDNFAVPKTFEAASHAGNAILHKMNAYSIKIVMNLLYESMGSMKWQTKKGALVILGALGTHHPTVVKQNLPDFILKLIDMSSDVKKEVKDQTRAAFTELCATITNVDIIPIIPRVIAAYMDPVKLTENALDALVSTTFINDVDISTLGLLVPVLTKGMRERKVVIKRRAALVIGNMCKLVNDPRTAATFNPILGPVLEKGIDEIAVDEVRKVCQDSLNTLARVSAEAQVLSDAVMTADQLEEAITTSLAKNGLADTAKYSVLIKHMAKSCHGLVLADDRDAVAWAACLVTYAKALLSEVAALTFCDEVTAIGTAALSPEKVDPEDEEEDLCNATFSLAYGTRVLLHQTPFKVKRGRRYGLVGPNGAGKSTLMRAIAGGNLAGFPTELITVYVECEIIGEKAEMSVLDYIMTDHKVISSGAEEKTVREMLTFMGFGVSRTAAAIEAGVGTLSGGWRMKLALSRAMLLNPDMLLLDEPTNQ